jgi:alkylresorcinol/alkylpyrone synthase
MSIIASIGTAVPPYRNEQAHIAEFMLNLMNADESQSRRIRQLYEHSTIQTRYSGIRDYSNPVEEREFYPLTEDLEPFPDIGARMQQFFISAIPLSIDAVNACINPEQLKTITHLITVSCTGMAAPGLDIELVQELGLPLNIYRTSVNFMGCYAAFHALKIADAICNSDPEAEVLVVCVELCTLHFQKGTETDVLVANSLFADGAAAIKIVSDKKHKGQGLKISGFYSEIAPNGKSDMAWKLSASGFLMTLSAYIPALVKESVLPLLANALKKLDVPAEEIQHWAIHPGGKKILEAVQESLSLEKEKLSSSYRVLRDFGNMSSPTVLFVLNDLWENCLRWEKNERIFSAGFGPGLTLESAVFETVK